jgi:hypothetical protein
MREDEKELARMIRQDERRAKLEAIDQGLCRVCGKGHYHFSAYCGADVCDKCYDHKGLAMCYCGWKSGGGHATALDFAECGVRIDEEP